VVIEPSEVIWSQTYLGGNNYQGIWSGNINVLSGLSGGKTYYLHIWAKSWGTEGDSWLSNSGANYVATFTTDASLPVTLSAFTAKAVKGNVVLEWKTSSEIENQGFILSRAEKGLSNTSVIASFVTNNALKGQGTTTETTSYTYVDETVEPGKTYVYTLADVDYAGNETVLQKVEVKVESEGTVLAEGYALKTVYPNPFNPSVTVSYHIPQETTVSFVITDLTGRTIWSAERTHFSAGTYELVWEGTTREGSTVPSGLYILKMSAGPFKQATKLTLLR
ncbi:MAG: FlgD immunoglobulin-like domain containing protein, partial [Candidatus Marinimicrobia bacterium]|nr:FlgD immunoglobulin-like domain containing protein [Candidatus Neomarinimicrobiota bacterium]